jgi:propanol-preferring alcohol dehydrogenase
MQAMLLTEPGKSLQLSSMQTPTPKGHEVLLEIEACAVCRTDLHVVDNELPSIHYPIIPGHQVVGRVISTGKSSVISIGTRVGVAWLAGTCQSCSYCSDDRENLCDAAIFHGYMVNGGYADMMIADSRYIFPIASDRPAESIAPLLCGGLIGYRSLQMTGKSKQLGIYGFGSAAHLITQLAVYQGREIYAFTRPGDTAAQQLARACGAVWAGDSNMPAPTKLEAGIIFAAAGELVPKALTDLRKGGVVVCGGIHMSDIPSFPYADLWGERSIRSVANMTRKDGLEFMALATASGLEPRTESFPLSQANQALQRLRDGKISGTAVLVPD